MNEHNEDRIVAAAALLVQHLDGRPQTVDAVLDALMTIRSAPAGAGFEALGGGIYYVLCRRAVAAAAPALALPVSGPVN
ncbi:MAG: hypothetical protein U1F54_23060 [Burkholderiales bacterium]